MARLARLCTVIAVVLVLGMPLSSQAQDEQASVRIIHGASDLGPVDLYLDGALAVVGAAFPSATDPLMVDGGEHRITVTPSGFGFDQALADSVVEIEPGSSGEIAIVGPAENITAVLFPMDRSSLDEDRARVRVIHVSPDTGPLDPLGLNGDQIFPTVEYLQATEYAEVPLGAFPLALLYSGTDAIAVDLPDLALELGTIVDLYVVGQVSDGTVQPLLVAGDAELVPLVGRPARVVQGTCVEPGVEVASLGVVAEPRGDPVGSATGMPVNTAFASIPLAFETIVGEVHSIEIDESEQSGAAVEACAVIGGPLTDDGSLAVQIRERGTGALRGIAVLAPSVLDPSQTDISILLVPVSEQLPGTSTEVSDEPATSDQLPATSIAVSDAPAVSDQAIATPAATPPS